MTAYPEPHEAVGGFDCEGPVVPPNPHRPETPHLLEVEGRMVRVVSQVSVGSVGERLDLCRQRSVAGPEIW